MTGHTLPTAEERLHQAQDRAVNYVEEELPTLAPLAELYRQRRQYGTALELLEQVWAPAHRRYDSPVPDRRTRRVRSLAWRRR